MKKLFSLLAVLLLQSQAMAQQPQAQEQFPAYINGLPTTSLLGPSDQFYVRQGGVSKQVVFSALAAAVGTGISTINVSVPTGLAVSGAPCAMTNCTFGFTWNGAIPNAQIPPPTASSLGGVQSAAGATGQFMTGISVTGVPQFGTPAGAGNVSTSGTITPGGCAQWNTTTSLVSVAACGTGGGGSGANPSASVGLTAVNGVATTFTRSDGAPALSQSIVPTWTGLHTFGANIAVSGSTSGVITLAPQAAAGTWNWNWPVTAGTAGQVLASGGGGSTAMTWTTVSTSTPVFQTISGTSPQSATISTASYVTSTVTGGSPNSVTVTLPVGPAVGTTITFTLGNTQATNIVSASSNIIPLESTTTDTVIIGTPGSGVAAAEWASIVYNGTNWDVVAGGSTGGGGGGSLPTFQTYQTLTSGSSASFNATSSNVAHIKVRMVGGGGGGGAQSANSGGSGGTTVFGGWNANGGTGGAPGNNSTNAAGGSGGSNGTGTLITRLSGGNGTSGTSGVSALTAFSPAGCASPFGGAGGGATNNAGSAAVANTGSGGAGGGGQGSTGTGSSGACGEYVEFFMTKAQFAGVTYTVGAGGTAGAAGNTAGGAGGTGIILVEEFYY